MVGFIRVVLVRVGEMDMTVRLLHYLLRVPSPSSDDVGMLRMIHIYLERRPVLLKSLKPSSPIDAVHLDLECSYDRLLDCVLIRF